MNIKIFRANRGEGKTKWLFERAVEEYNKGKDLYYVGNLTTMRGLTDMWEVNMHERCPIIPIKEVSVFAKPYCFITDDIFRCMHEVNHWLDYAEKNDGAWYITMNKEDFVN